MINAVKSFVKSKNNLHVIIFIPLLQIMTTKNTEIANSLESLVRKPYCCGLRMKLRDNKDYSLL